MYVIRSRPSSDSQARRLGPGGTCLRCGYDVVSADSRAAPPADVVCDTCVAELRPLSTWPGHQASGHWWISEVIEHERACSVEVLLCDGQELVRYRRDGDRLLLVARPLVEELQGPSPQLSCQRLLTHPAA